MKLLRMASHFNATLGCCPCGCGCCGRGCCWGWQLNCATVPFVLSSVRGDLLWVHGHAATQGPSANDETYWTDPEIDSKYAKRMPRHLSMSLQKRLQQIATVSMLHAFLEFLCFDFDERKASPIWNLVSSLEVGMRNIPIEGKSTNPSQQCIWFDSDGWRLAFNRFDLLVTDKPLTERGWEIDVDQ